MELRTAARRRVATYTAAVTVAGRDPGPVLLLAALVLAAELMPLELGRPGINSAQLATAIGVAGAVYGLAGGEPGRAQVSLPAFAAAALAFFVVNNLLVEAVLVLAGGTPALGQVGQGVGLRPGCRPCCLASPRWSQWSPRPASAWSRSSACPRRPSTWPAGAREATRFGPLAVLAVTDTGPGVPPADRERIFERFTQLDSGATRRAGGVGLGLYIARQLANAQGGELLLTDPVPPGPGARFELRLPLAELAFRRPG